jgi:hypothetical protein
MYDLMEAKIYQPKGNYTIDPDACIDCRKEHLVAALDAEETAGRHKTEAQSRSIFRSFAKLFAPAQRTMSVRRFVSE